MSLPARRCLLLFAILFFLAAAGCGGFGGASSAVSASPTQAAAAAGESSPPAAPAADCAPTGPQVEGCPAGLASPSPSVPLPSRTPATPLPPLEPAAASPTPSPLPEPSPTACPPGLCVYENPFQLGRPIASPGVDRIDASYRFGSTQDGQRDPHHGVEFLNPAGTPVLAAADGVVVVAGDDRTTFYGPYSYFYGNLVVVEHDLPGLVAPLYSLYGHLSEISVREGNQVQAGQQLGRVGMSGVATGSHLHFEVRLGENTYASARNPELWLAPHTNEAGEPMGALAGRILDPFGPGEPIPVVLQRLPAPGQPPGQPPGQAHGSEIYLQTYAEKALLGQPPYEESFAAGDLPAGWYRISFARYGVQEQVVQVFPNQVTLVTFRLEE